MYVYVCTAGIVPLGKVHVGGGLFIQLYGSVGNSLFLK